MGCPGHVFIYSAMWGGTGWHLNTWRVFLFQLTHAAGRQPLAMNCLLEMVAGMWMHARRQVVTEPPDEEVVTAQDGLEQCRRNMEAREREFQVIIARLNEEALAKKREGDIPAARAKLVERRRCSKRLERLRHGLDLVDNQLDAIKTSELDKEIMLTLKASTAAMRKAGINLGVEEVETVMSELDEQMREVQDITSVLSAPLQDAATSAEEAELDAELGLLEAVMAVPPVSLVAPSNTIAPDRSIRRPPPALSEADLRRDWRPRRAGEAEAVV
jgi:hypothetical protein